MENIGKPHSKPTPRAEWAKVGDVVTATDGPGAMRGVVQAIGRGSIPAARVRWANGAIGRHSLTALKTDRECMDARTVALEWGFSGMREDEIRALGRFPVLPPIGLKCHRRGSRV